MIWLITGLFGVGIALGAIAVLIGGASHAQQYTIPSMRAVVVATCGTAPWTYVAGQEMPLTVNVNGQLCTI